MNGYFQPTNLMQACAWMSANNGQVVAGCTDILAATEFQALQGLVLDVTALAALRGISSNSTGWRIGAATPWSEIRDADLPPAFTGLQQAAAEVGSVQIQNSGTIGGNLCNASPAADGVPPLLVLGAEVELVSSGGRRMLALADFILGPRHIDLRPDELLVAVHIPADYTKGSSGFVKLGARRFLVISIAMAAARLVVENGIIQEAAVSVGSCGPVAKRLGVVENALIGQTAKTAVASVTPEMVAAEITPIDDIRADRQYRLDAGFEVVKRALAQVLEVEK